MPKAKSKTSVGLGNTLMNDRFGKGKGSDRKEERPSLESTTPLARNTLSMTGPRAAWVKMRSVTEQGALDEFLATAELAGTDFTAEKMNNVKIIQTDQRNPYLLSAAEESAVRGKQREHRDALPCPGDLDGMHRPRRMSWIAWRGQLPHLEERPRGAPGES